MGQENWTRRGLEDCPSRRFELGIFLTAVDLSSKHAVGQKVL